MTPADSAKSYIVEPQRMEAMRIAFYKTCEALHLTPADALTELVAAKIVQLGTAGESDPERLCSQTLDALAPQQKAS